MRMDLDRYCLQTLVVFRRVCSAGVVGGLRHYHGLVLRATMDPRDHGCVGCGSGT